MRFDVVFALLVLLNWAMRRPLSVGRVTVWTPTLFFVYKTKQFINRYIWEPTAQMLLYEALLLILFSVGIRTISVHEFFGILYRGNNSRDCLL